jgi:hypothetical protein
MQKLFPGPSRSGTLRKGGMAWSSLHSLYTRQTGPLAAEFGSPYLIGVRHIPLSTQSAACRYRFVVIVLVLLLVIVPRELIPSSPCRKYEARNPTRNNIEGSEEGNSKLLRLLIRSFVI